MEESALALTRKYRPAPGALLANIDDLLHRFDNRAPGEPSCAWVAIRCAN